MKIFAFRTRLILFSIIQNFLCYAVVNLRFNPRLKSDSVCSAHGFIAAGCLYTIQPLPKRVVGSNGLGPSTSRLSGVCSNQLSYEPMCGGGNRIRTDDPLLAGQVLYQLSYTPILFANLSLCENKCSPFKEACFLLKMNKKETFISDRLRNGQIVQLAIRLFSLKGGDPAAPSDTATLLRLHPSHRYYLRQLPPCG